MNAAQIRAAAGRVDSGSSGIECAWVALASRPTSGGEAVLRLEHKMNRALAVIDWAAQCTEEECQADLVSIDKALASAITTVNADAVEATATVNADTVEIVALGGAARIPGLFAPTGGVMWVSGTERGPAAGASEHSVGPLTPLDGGWVMWHEPGAWCALISGKPSQMVRIARRVGASPHESPLLALTEACREEGVDRMIAVSDGTGTPSGYGGVAYCIDGEVRTILLD